MTIPTGYDILRSACAVLMAFALLSGCESKDSYEEKLALTQEAQALRQEVQDLTKDRGDLEESVSRLGKEKASLVAVIEIEKIIAVVAGESPEKTIVATKSGIRVVQKIKADDRIQKKLAHEHQGALEGGYHLEFHQAIGEHGSGHLKDEFGKFCKGMKTKEASCP